MQAGAESEQTLEFAVRTKSAGVLEAVLGPDDVFAGDNTARLELPAYQPRPIEVLFGPRGRWRPLAASILSAEPSFRHTSEFGVATGNGPCACWTVFVPRGAARGRGDFRGAAPGELAFAGGARSVEYAHHALGIAASAGGRAQRCRFPAAASAEVFEISPGDVMIAECAAGPVIVLREQGGKRHVFVGFDLLDEKLQGRLSTPLLFANIVRWFAPEVFRGEAVQASAPGLIEWDMPPVREQDVQVVSSQDAHIPWRLVDNRLRLFAGAPGVVTIRTPEQESRLSLTLPEVGDARWEPPERTLRGVPPPAHGALLAGVPLWPWLSLLALAILAVDWRYYGRGFTETAVAVEGTLEPAASAGLTGLGLGNGAGRSREREEQLTR